MRVRETTSGKKIKTKQTAKERFVDAHGKTLRREEDEKKVASAEEAVAALETKGYVVTHNFIKMRTTFTVEHTGNTFEIVRDVFDTPSELGTFYEVELQHNGMSTEDGLPLIYRLLQSIGLHEITIYDRSYTHMLENPSWHEHPEWGFAQEVDLASKKEEKK